MFFKDVSTHAHFAFSVANPELLVSWFRKHELTLTADMSCHLRLALHTVALFSVSWVVFLVAFGWCWSSQLQMTLNNSITAILYLAAVFRFPVNRHAVW